MPDYDSMLLDRDREARAIMAARESDYAASREPNYLGPVEGKAFIAATIADFDSYDFSMAGPTLHSRIVTLKVKLKQGAHPTEVTMDWNSFVRAVDELWSTRAQVSPG